MRPDYFDRTSPKKIFVETHSAKLLQTQLKKKKRKRDNSNERGSEGDW